MTDWKSLSNGRLIADVGNGIILVKPKGSPDPVPLFCVVCDTPNTDPDDAVSHRQDGCCRLCSLRWVDANREAWTTGWRPSSDDVAREIVRRRMRPRQLLI